MRAEELMIGDFVTHFTGEICKVISLLGGEYKDNVAVSWIDKKGRKQYTTTLQARDFNPIPLTSEILEKNGFKECTNGEWTNNNVDFILYQRKDGVLRIQNTNMTLPFVHQFQHALRLCGIDKEIELWA